MNFFKDQSGSAAVITTVIILGAVGMKVVSDRLTQSNQVTKEVKKDRTLSSADSSNLAALDYVNNLFSYENGEPTIYAENYFATNWKLASNASSPENWSLVGDNQINVKLPNTNLADFKLIHETGALSNSSIRDTQVVISQIDRDAEAPYVEAQRLYARTRTELNIDGVRGDTKSERFKTVTGLINLRDVPDPEIFFFTSNLTSTGHIGNGTEQEITASKIAVQSTNAGTDTFNVEIRVRGLADGGHYQFAGQTYPLNTADSKNYKSVFTVGTPNLEISGNAANTGSCSFSTATTSIFEGINDEDLEEIEEWGSIVEARKLAQVKERVKKSKEDLGTMQSDLMGSLATFNATIAFLPSEPKKEGHDFKKDLGDVSDEDKSGKAQDELNKASEHLNKMKTKINEENQKIVEENQKEMDKANEANAKIKAEAEAEVAAALQAEAAAIAAATRAETESLAKTEAATQARTAAEASPGEATETAANEAEAAALEASKASEEAKRISILASEKASEVTTASALVQPKLKELIDPIKVNETLTKANQLLTMGSQAIAQMLAIEDAEKSAKDAEDDEDFEVSTQEFELPKGKDLELIVTVFNVKGEPIEKRLTIEANAAQSNCKCADVGLPSYIGRSRATLSGEGGDVCYEGGLRGTIYAVFGTNPYCVKEKVQQGRQSCGCFDEATMITMGDKSLKKISEIVPGETVFNPLTKKAVPVMYVSKGPEKVPMLRIKSAGKTVLVTSKHPFPTRRGILPAFRLNMDDVLIEADGVEQAIDSIEVITSDAPKIVWNLMLGGKANAKDHMLIGNGMVTGDLFIQNELEKRRHKRERLGLSTK